MIYGLNSYNIYKIMYNKYSYLLGGVGNVCFLLGKGNKTKNF